MDAYKIALEAIDMFLEYRDRHGFDETEARIKAALEIEDGVNAIETGSDKGLDLAGASGFVVGKT